MSPRHTRSAHIKMQAKQAYTYSFLSCISVLFVSVVWYVYMSEGDGERFRCRGGQKTVLDLELELQIVTFSFINTVVSKKYADLGVHVY